MVNNKDILFFDYSAVNSLVKDDIIRNINNALTFKTTKEYDKLVEEFERSYADYCGTRDCIALNSGTSALQLAMLSIGIKEGDEVILPVYTYAASAIAVSNIGAKPVFVDILESDLTIDPNKIEKSITPRTRAIMAVHIHGNPCDIEAILEICRKHKLVLIEDASQAHGALYKKKKIGSFGIGCFSLHMSKNLGAFSSAGAITFNTLGLREKLAKYIAPDNNTIDVLMSGRTPCEMDAIHACFLIPKLKVLDSLNKRKREIANLYDQNIINPMFKKPILNNKSTGVYRDYFIMCKDRDSVMDKLRTSGIGTKVRYKVPLHLTKTFSYLGYKIGDFEVAERVVEEIICLPTYIGLSDDDIIRICSEINKTKQE